MSRLFPGGLVGRTTTMPVSDYPFTFVGWYRYSAGNSQGTLAAIGGIISFTNPIAVNNSAPGLELLVGTNYISTTASHGSEDTWHHFALIATSSTSHRLVQDGYWSDAAVSTNTWSWEADYNRFSIAAWMNADGGNNFAVADLAHIAIWNSGLSSTDVSSLAAGGNPLMVSGSSLVGYWPLAGIKSPEPDSKKVNNMVIPGAPPRASGDPTVDAPPAKGTLTLGIGD